MSGLEPRVSLPGGAAGFVAGGDLDAARRELSAAAVRADAVDPVVTELVRLRCAQVHDCRRCGSLRLAESLELGLDDEATEQIAELCLDVVKWSQQKLLVALRLDAPTWEATATLSFDADGAPVVGGPATA